MGGSNSEEEDQQQLLLQQQQELQQQQDAAAPATPAAPETIIDTTFTGDGPLAYAENATEAKLYAVSERACQWKDANEYAFRLRQIELLNFTIKTLSQDIWKAADQIDFQRLHKESMAYKNAYGKDDQVHNWEILAKDPLFVPADDEVTYFASYADYFVKNSGAPVAVNKENFEQYLKQFIKLRDRLFQYLGRHCVLQPPPPPPAPPVEE